MTTPKRPMPPRRKLVIFGLSDLARLACFYFENDSSYEVVAFTAHAEYVREPRWLGHPVVPFERLEVLYPPHHFCLFVAIGYKGVNKARAEIYTACKSRGYELVSYVSSTVVNLGQVKIGANCFILENAVIQPFVNIGNDVIIWAGTHIGHDSIVKDHTFIAPCVAISGNVRIGPYCFIGINATLRDGISIGRGCIIGAGVTILRDTQPEMVCSKTGAEPENIPALGVKGF